MKVCVTGATGFLGAHVTRGLIERGDEVRVTYRNPDRLEHLKGLEFRRAKTDVLDFEAMRRAVSDVEVLFHTVGYVGSFPAERVWRLNAHAPVVAVEAAAAEGVRRVVLTSTISAIGPATNGGPADESTEYPEEWLHLAYPDSKHEGELAALEAGERHGIEVVVVNPAYLLGVPVDRSQPGETSTRAVILGGENWTWPELIDCVARISGDHHPIVVLPREIVWVARLREALGLPAVMSVEGYELMGKDWRFSCAKAERELGYRARPVEETVRATVEWYQELIESGAFSEDSRSGMSTLADGLGRAGSLGLLHPIRLGQCVLGRRVIAGV